MSSRIDQNADAGEVGPVVGTLWFNALSKR